MSPSSLAFAALLLAASPGDEKGAWPVFRGPDQTGRVEGVDLPLRWSEEQNVGWKTPIHGRGHSSPVVWDSEC